MNYLSHIYLSGDNEDIILGNFLGDYVKGHLSKLHDSSYNKDIILGIALHRQIDAFTDQHPIVKQSMSRIRHRYHKFSGIVIDMFYDHIFAKNFHHFSAIELENFSANFYQILQKREDDLPAALDRMIISMTSRDWLTNYANLEGLKWSLKGISSRLKYESDIENATEILTAQYQEFEDDFFQFFPEIQAHCQKFIENPVF